MNVLEDKYTLKDSVIVILEEDDAKFLEVDFKDEESEVLNGEIYGFIKGEDDIPIKDANIQIMDENYSFLMETFSDSDGNYLFTGVKPNVDYRVYVIAPTIELENPISITIKELERYELNFILKFQENINFLALKGSVEDITSNKPISGAVIYAFSLDSKNNESLVSIEVTDEKGNFYFWQIPPGKYHLKITASGYKTTTITKLVNGINSEVEILIQLEEFDNILKGTIYGVIKDSNGNPIVGADVILYKVYNASEIPIKFTKSDDDGVYLFEEVDDGDYKIKADKLVDKNI